MSKHTTLWSEWYRVTTTDMKGHESLYGEYPTRREAQQAAMKLEVRVSDDILIKVYRCFSDLCD